MSLIHAISPLEMASSQALLASEGSRDMVARADACLALRSACRVKVNKGLEG